MDKHVRRMSVHMFSQTGAQPSTEYPPSTGITAPVMKSDARLARNTAMLAPARASPRAIPSPMPLLPPVTSATFPVRSNESMSVSRTDW